MRRAAVFILILLLQACASPPPARDCPSLPTLPVNPTTAQRGQHTEALVALYLQCAGVTQ